MYDSVVLFSGGIDSTYVLSSLIKEGNNPFAVLVDYDQPHKVELEKAELVCMQLGVDYHVFKLPLIQKVNDVVFSARNMLLISLGCMVANSKSINELYIGCNRSDYERFADCRDSFLNPMKDVCAIYNVNLNFPLLHKDKKEVIRLLKDLDEGLYKMTWTCYSPIKIGGDLVQCGKCYSCKGVKSAEKLQD